MIISNNISKTINSNSTSNVWKANPDLYSPRMNFLHIWKVDLDQFPYVENALSILSGKEYIRVSRMIDPLKKKRYGATHLALRYILSQYLEVLPRSIEFQYSEFGKPYLDKGSYKPLTFFNLSHSEGYMLLALTSENQIGIDLEKILPVSSTDKILENYFSSTDIEFFQQCSSIDKELAFFYLWTLKEAYGKALGSGIARTSDRVLTQEGGFNNLKGNQFSAFHQNDCWFYSFIPEEKFIASVAVKSLNIPVPQYFSYTYGNDYTQVRDVIFNQ